MIFSDISSSSKAISYANMCFLNILTWFYFYPNKMMQNSIVGVQNGGTWTHSMQTNVKEYEFGSCPGVQDLSSGSRSPGPVQWLSKSPGLAQEDKSFLKKLPKQLCWRGSGGLSFVWVNPAPVGGASTRIHFDYKFTGFGDTRSRSSR